MAQVLNIVARRAAVWAGIESTFGSASASMVRQFPCEGTIDCTLITSQLPNQELRTRSADFLPPVHGLQDGSTFKLKAYWRPDTTQLGTTTTATTPWLGVLMRAAFGGEFPVSGTTNTGVTVSGGTASAIQVTAGHGARLSKGAFFFPQVSNVVEPGFVTNIASGTPDVITVVPALSAAPTATTAFNGYNYYFTESPPPSLTIEFALADSASQQYRLLGCVCTGLEVELTRDALLAFTFTFEAAAYQGPADLSLSVTQATNPMAAPMAMTGAQVILQSTATTTYPASFYSVVELRSTFDLGTRFAPELGGTQGKAGVMRVLGRPAVKTSIVAYPDISSTTTVPVTTWWSPQLPLQMQLRAYAGSGSSRRWCAFAIPTSYIVGQPDGSEAIDNILTYSWEMHAALNALTSSPTTDIHYSPAVFAAG